MVVDDGALAVCDVIDIDVDGDDPKIKIGRLYSSCAIVRPPPVVLVSVCGSAQVREFVT